VTDRRLDGLGLVPASSEDPFQYAQVLAEARPDELAVLVAAEPVDLEDLRRMLEFLADAASQWAQ
jgi:hypothetical protein